MKRRTEKEWVFRPNRLWVYCPMILEFLGVWSLEEKMNREKKGWYLEKDPSRWSFARGHSILSIICNRQIHADDHLQEASHSRWSFARPGPSRWSFAKGRSIWMIICKGHVYHDNYLQEAGPSWWSFGRDYSILMIIYKRPVQPDDHLQEASPSWWSFARGQSIRMIICKMLVHPHDHLQEAGPSWWSLMMSLICCPLSGVPIIMEFLYGLYQKGKDRTKLGKFWREID